MKPFIFNNKLYTDDDDDDMVGGRGLMSIDYAYVLHAYMKWVAQTVFGNEFLEKWCVCVFFFFFFECEAK